MVDDRNVLLISSPRSVFICFALLFVRPIPVPRSRVRALRIGDDHHPLMGAREGRVSEERPRETTQYFVVKTYGIECVASALRSWGGPSAKVLCIESANPIVAPPHLSAERVR